ncbi:MAG: ATP-binding protein [Bryobacterales bacterium]|nr:ATP-binding protein [Bryobacterales bacterium]
MDFPDAAARQVYDNLIGLDAAKAVLTAQLSICFDLTSLSRWWERYHGLDYALLAHVLHRPNLVILFGDVGTGKTALAESVGDVLARRHRIPVTLFPMSLGARGSGRVGQMTSLIASAFDVVVAEAERTVSPEEKPKAGFLLLVDEADALAQSRQLDQMHHEDRAGVNAFIRGVDHVTRAGVPVGILLCTNRLSSLDPAVRRRAASLIEFTRPTEKQRHEALRVLGTAGLKESQIAELARITGPRDRTYGFTYSDIFQRLIPQIVLDAYPRSPVTFDRAQIVASTIQPTPPITGVAQS